MSKPVRVLQYGSVVGGGGIGAFLINLYREIDKSRVQFDFLHHMTDAGVDKRTLDEIESLGGRVFGIPQLRRSPIEARRQINEVIATTGVDIIHCNMTLLTQLIPVKIAASVGIPVIVHSHCTTRSFQKGLLESALSFDLDLFADNLTLYTHKINQKKIQNYPCEYFACSKAAGIGMFGQKISDAGKVFVLNNAIQTRKFTYNVEKSQSAKLELGLEGKFIIGNVARFDYQKNHDFMIDVFAEVRKQCTEAVLLLAGDGIRKAEIEAKVRDMGLAKSVMLLGNRSDVPDLLQAMDIFFLPSHYEGLPVVLIEAQAAGLPCFISEAVTREADMTGICEYISLDKPTSYWAGEIMKYANGYERKDTYADIVKAGYDAAHTAEYMADYYCGLLKR